MIRGAAVISRTGIFPRSFFCFSSFFFKGGEMHFSGALWVWPFRDCRFHFGCCWLNFSNDEWQHLQIEICLLSVTTKLRKELYEWIEKACNLSRFSFQSFFFCFVLFLRPFRRWRISVPNGVERENFFSFAFEGGFGPFSVQQNRPWTAPARIWTNKNCSYRQKEKHFKGGKVVWGRRENFTLSRTCRFFFF